MLTVDKVGNNKVNPARAGMILADQTAARTGDSKPRASGDDPEVDWLRCDPLGKPRASGDDPAVMGGLPGSGL